MSEGTLLVDPCSRHTSQFGMEGRALGLRGKDVGLRPLCSGAMLGKIVVGSISGPKESFSESISWSNFVFFFSVS